MNRKGFTLLELLVVLGLIGVIAIAIIVLINPLQQFAKARDSQRKHDAQALQKSLDEYYNDNGCYPRPAQVCAPTPPPTNICTGGGATTTIRSQICEICGSRTGSPSFSPYMSKLPCDPKSPTNDYLYEVEVPTGSYSVGGQCSALTLLSSNFCPQWYRLYVDLEGVGVGQEGTDNDSRTLGCYPGGCGLSKSLLPTQTTPYGYDYGVSSGTVVLESSDRYVCYVDGSPGACNTCSSCDPGDSACQAKNLYERCVTSGGCPDTSKIYSSSEACNAANGL